MSQSTGYANVKLPDLYENLRFRVTALHSSRARTYPLELVERVTWNDVNAILTGDIALRIPPGNAPSPELRLDQGDRIKLEANPGNGWREVFTMRTYQPQATASNQQRTFNLANDLDLLRQSEDNFLFDRDGLHPHGWTGPQVIKYICSHYQIQIGRLYSSSKPIGKIRVRRGSPLTAIRNVLLREKRKYDRRLVLSFDKGRLNVLPLKRSADLLALGPTLMEAAFSSQLPPQFGTAVTMHSLPELIQGSQSANGRVKGKVQKGHVYQSNFRSTSLFGYVHRIVFSPDAITDAQLLNEAKAWLAAVTAPQRTLTITHRGMPWLKRGDAIQLTVGDEGLKKQLVWVNQVQHTLTADSYQMDVTVIFDDPYLDQTRQKVYNRLKSTHDEAVGDRARLNPLWNFPPNNKGDAAVTQSQDPFTVPGADVAGSTDGAGLGGGPFGG